MKTWHLGRPPLRKTWGQARTSWKPRKFRASPRFSSSGGELFSTEQYRPPISERPRKLVSVPGAGREVKRQRLRRLSPFSIERGAGEDARLCPEQFISRRQRLIKPQRTCEGGRPAGRPYALLVTTLPRATNAALVLERTCGEGDLPVAPTHYWWLRCQDHQWHKRGT